MSAVERYRRALVDPANRVVVLDPEPEPAPTGPPFVYVHIDTVNLTQPAAPARAPRAPARPAPRRRKRRRGSPVTRAILRPIFALAFAIAAVYLMRVLLADPTVITDHARTLAP